jgi:hypothetical protein
MAQLSSYQVERLDQAKDALAASLADEDNPKAYAKHLGAVEVELAGHDQADGPVRTPSRQHDQRASRTVLEALVMCRLVIGHIGR